MTVMEYLPRLDRWLDLRVGLCGPGMPAYVMDEVEFGARVASGLANEECEGAVNALLWLTQPPSWWRT